MRWLGLFLVGCGASSVSPPVTAPEPPPAPVVEKPSDGLTDVGADLRGLTVGASGARPVLVALHGRGDHPSRFVGLAKGWADVAHVVVPAATIPYGEGFSWFNIRASQDDPTLAAAVSEAVRRVVQLVNARRPDGHPVVVTGFSQGGMLSFALATHETRVVDGAVPMGGFLPRGMWPESKPDNPPPIFAVHGEADTIIPVTAPRATVAHLESLGWPVELVTTPGVGHSLTPDMRRRVDVEARKMLGGVDADR